MSRALAPPSRPVRRTRVVAGTLVAVALLAGLVGLADALRPPATGASAGGGRGVAEGVPPVDPRTEVVCEDQPREGQEREPAGGPPTLRQVTSHELLDCPQIWDGRRIRFVGEAVGAVLPRSGGAWVQLNDDVYGVGLGPLPGHGEYRGSNSGVGAFLPSGAVDAIRHVGGPGIAGDVVEVTGTFHRIDPSTRELVVLRAESVAVVAPGGRRDVETPGARRAVALVLASLALATVAAERLVARRR